VNDESCRAVSAADQLRKLGTGVKMTTDNLQADLFVCLDITLTLFSETDT